MSCGSSLSYAFGRVGSFLDHFGERILLADEGAVDWISSRPLMRRLEVLWVAATSLGNGYVWGLLGLYLILFGGRADRLNVLVGLGVMMVEVTVFRVFKGLFSRPRPALRGRLPRRWFMDTFAFPSGHTTAAFGMAYLVTQLYPQPLTLAAVYSLACAIGISRVYLRDHYLIDVVAGAVLGTIVAHVVLPVFYQIIHTARW